MRNFESYLEYSDEVLNAKEEGLPIIALESTIISHGMPYPENVKMAKTCERIIRDNGCIPATIAVINGKIKIGLDDDDLEYLASAKDVAKVSRRDLAYIVSTKKTGATTVASTMICAGLANIKFFVTGGIGGVHRGYNEHMDVSADLEELATTNVNVICAGAKSILDLGRTLEYLETKGVPVIGYGTEIFPAFFTRDSKYKLNTCFNDVNHIAKMIKTKDDLGLRGGTIIANPIPVEYQLEKSFIDSIVDDAILEGERKGIEGKDVTPFLLSTIVEKTEGKSLEANIELVYNNAKVGAQIAYAYYQTK
ncbi:pseudouridine-5'-phosphate glycosidase [Proteiniborus ethanoligenes]|uniref:Pseudouridine-5'-phosphate glycosidase n=1 Tax=Proteiniborus ethanoligenes TaxID=415015 RepID=A0A1H3LNV2_9FIRM|nr:pseudouridine-5'-phosphate glycosidase [Proteiniborus ethanoligenes]SDY65809.1 pseudouridine-5'-phosphate glycosidase [Proteiniborus ethanoligenes]